LVVNGSGVVEQRSENLEKERGASFVEDKVVLDGDVCLDLMQQMAVILQKVIRYAGEPTRRWRNEIRFRPCKSERGEEEKSE
jgi:hypothetical protein